MGETCRPPKCRTRGKKPKVRLGTEGFTEKVAPGSILKAQAGNGDAFMPKEQPEKRPKSGVAWDPRGWGELGNHPLTDMTGVTGQV